MMKKKALSLLLALCMVVGMLPMSVLAEDVVAGESHAITKIASPGGTYTVAETAYAGDTVTITAGSGYALSSVSVYKTDDPSTEVEVTDGTFTMPDYPVTVRAIVVPEGYTTDEYGLMAYAYSTYLNVLTFDIMGVFDGQWKLVTYKNYGFSTMLRIGDSTTDQSVHATSTEAGGYLVDTDDTDEIDAGLTIAIDLSIENKGQSVAIQYTVKNTTDAEITYGLASGSDIKIGSHDAAPITSFEGNTGFKMVSGTDKSSQANADGTYDYAQFNAFLSGAKGITDVDGYWYGAYSSWKNHYFSTVVDTNYSSGDSAAAWHWTDETIAADATNTYTIKMGIGGAGSEDVLGENEYNVTGRVVNQEGAPVEGVTVTLTEGKTATTDANGDYAIGAVKKGTYAATMTKDDKTQTATMIVSSTGDATDITLSDLVFMVDGDKNTTVETAGEGVPTVSADNLDAMFTTEDTESSSTVKITLKVEKNDASADKDTVDALISGQTDVGMYFDITLEKTVDGGTATNIQPPNGEAVTITLSLPEEHQDCAPYQIIHVHEGEVEMITPTYNADLQTLTFDASQFSTYAYTFKNSTIPLYGLTFAEMGTGGSEGGDYAAGDVVTISAGSQSGYTFAGWTTEDGGSFGNQSSATTTYTMPSNAVTLTATWLMYVSPTYRSTVEEPINGTVSLSSYRATLNRTITITPTPDVGYEVGSITVTYGSDSERTVTDNGDGTYCYKQPSATATVTVTFVSIAESTDISFFSDVTEDDWFYEAVRFVYANGMMAGTSDTAFNPEIGTTRGMIATILHRMEQSPEAGLEQIFADVASGEYYTDPVNWAAEHEIVKGYGDGNYGPEDNVTREQLAAILYRYAESKGMDTTHTEDLSDFSDADTISNYAIGNMNWAVANGLIAGKTGGILAPQAEATRAEVSLILMRFVELNK